MARPPAANLAQAPGGCEPHSHELHGSKRGGRRRALFSAVIYDKIARSESNYWNAQPNVELPTINSCIPGWWRQCFCVRAGICIMGAAPTSMPPDPPAILAHALSWKIRVTRVQHYSRGTRARTWFDLGEPGRRRELEPSAFASCVGQQIVDRAQDRNRGRERRDPGDTRSVAVVGSRQHPAH